MITAPLPQASPSGTGRLSMTIPRYYGLEKWLPLKGRAGVIPYIFLSSIALFSSLFSCSFYILDLRTISSVNILEIT